MTDTMTLTIIHPPPGMKDLVMSPETVSEGLNQDGMKDMMNHAIQTIALMTVVHHRLIGIQMRDLMSGTSLDIQMTALMTDNNHQYLNILL
jgi:hypothetical protein